MVIRGILNVVVICLLLLAGLSGGALFLKATFIPDDGGKRTDTLWRLFWGGLIAGLILLASDILLIRVLHL